MRRGRRGAPAGASLVELIFGLLIGAIAVAGAYGIYMSVQQTAAAATAKTDALQQLNGLADLLRKDFSHADGLWLGGNGDVAYRLSYWTVPKCPVWCQGPVTSPCACAPAPYATNASYLLVMAGTQKRMTQYATYCEPNGTKGFRTTDTFSFTGCTSNDTHLSAECAPGARPVVDRQVIDFSSGSNVVISDEQWPKGVKTKGSKYDTAVAMSLCVNIFTPTVTTDFDIVLRAAVFKDRARSPINYEIDVAANINNLSGALFTP